MIKISIKSGILFLVLTVLSGCAQPYDAEAVHAKLKGYLVINEIQAVSTSDDDWIELYNPLSAAIDLSGFYLSDDPAAPYRWAFPDGSVILAENYLVVYANNNDKALSTNFTLGDDEAVILTTPGRSTVIDSVDYIDIDVPEDCSFGRSPDGSDFWITFASPTKGGPNN